LYGLYIILLYFNGYIVINIMDAVASFLKFEKVSYFPQNKNPT
jgi:hypothetical protein